MASDSKAKFLREGERYVQQGKISLAINEYLKITREDPDDVLTQNTVGDLYLRQGRVSEANQIFLQIAENYARNNFLLKAIAVYRKVLNTEPVNYDVSLKLASLYVRQGLNVDARNLYIAIGDLCAREGKNSEALEALEKAVEIDSTNVPIQLRLADAYLGQGSNDKAYGFLIGAARAQMKKGDIGASMGSFRHALAIRIGSSEALKGFLESALEADGLSASIAQVRESIDAADTDPALREVLGRAYMKEGDLDHAETCFETALAVDESRYVNFLSLFNTFLEGGKLDRALHCLDRIVPILISKRETQKLTECYDAILVRDPDHIDTLKQLADLISGSDEIRYRDLLERLARLYRINDRPGEALGIVERMLELYPDSEKHLRDHRELFGIVFPNLSYKSPTGEIDLHKRSGQVPAGLGNGDPDAGGPALVEIDLLLNYGMKDKALQLLSTMEFKKPSDKEVRLRLLSVYRECGEDRLAAQQAVLISTLYRKSGDKENAQKYWNEAVGLDSEWVNSGFDLVAFAADHGIQLEPEKIETAQQPGTLEVDLSGDLSEIFFKDAPAEAEANEEPAPDLTSCLRTGKNTSSSLAWWHWSANCWKNRGAHCGKPSGRGCPASIRATAFSSRVRPRSIRSCSAIRRSTDFMTISPSQLVADLPQEVLPPLDLALVLDALRREPVHHAQDATALLRLGQDDLRGVGGGAEDAADFRHHLQRVQHVQRVEAVAQEDDEASGPAPMAAAFFFASSIMAGSVPDQRTRHLPDASQKASPNLMPGTAPTSASWMSSTDLMKCVWPRMKLVSSGFSIFTVMSCMVRSFRSSVLGGAACLLGILSGCRERTAEAKTVRRVWFLPPAVRRRQEK